MVPSLNVEGGTLDTCQSTVTSRQHGPRVSHSTLHGSPAQFYSHTYLYNSSTQLDIQYTRLTCQLHAWHSRQLAWVRSCPICSLHNVQVAPFAAIPTVDSPQATVNHLKRPVAWPYTTHTLQDIVPALHNHPYVQLHSTIAFTPCGY